MSHPIWQRILRRTEMVGTDPPTLPTDTNYNVNLRITWKMVKIKRVPYHGKKDWEYVEHNHQESQLPHTATDCVYSENLQHWVTRNIRIDKRYQCLTPQWIRTVDHHVVKHNENLAGVHEPGTTIHRWYLVNILVIDYKCRPFSIPLWKQRISFNVSYISKI